jgi:serine/threonine protein kinase
VQILHLLKVEGRSIRPLCRNRLTERLAVQGRVRITDFGLAGFADQFTGGEIRAGTPAYMSPEQLAGREVSVKSDIYSLGLVLYELFTGRRAREGTATDLLDQSHGSSPTSPSSIVEDIDPAVERVILRCLENEPSARPSSALAVDGIVFDEFGNPVAYYVLRQHPGDSAGPGGGGFHQVPVFAASISAALPSEYVCSQISNGVPHSGQRCPVVGSPTSR